MVAEHVLAPARFAANGHIGLEVRNGGFATPAFGSPPTVVCVDGNGIAIVQGAQEKRTSLTTLAAAAAFADTPLGAPADVYQPSTVCDPDAPLTIDGRAARQLMAWYELVDSALRALAATEGLDSVPTLWPEHLDVAVRIGDVNVGGLAGDDAVPDPYVYVGPPPDVVARDAFFSQPFGAVRTWHELSTKDDITSFFRDGLTRAAAASRRPA